MNTDIQEIQDLTMHLQELLERLSPVMTDKDRAVVNRICEIVNTAPPDEIDLDTICRLILQLFSIWMHFHQS